MKTYFAKKKKKKPYYLVHNPVPGLESLLFTIFSPYNFILRLMRYHILNECYSFLIQSVNTYLIF